MKLMVPCTVTLLVGIAAGIGIGMMMTKPKLEEKQTLIAELQTQAKEFETSEAQSEDTLRKASAEIARQKKDLVRMAGVMRDVNLELMRVKADLAKYQTPEQPAAAAEEAPGRQPGAAATGPNVATKEYTVQEGDNLWKIAEAQLDNGIRFKEIIKLNPGITEQTVLKEGMKLKLPSQ